MRDALTGALGRAGWRLDAAAAFAVGVASAAQLVLDRSQSTALRAGLGIAVVVECAAILARRRYPLAAALTAGAVSFLPGLVIGARWANAIPIADAFGLVLLAYTVGSCERDARGLLGLVALVLGFSAGDFSDPVPMLVFTVPAWVAGGVVQSRNRLAEQLRARAQELDREREAYAREAVRYERAKIARELHDIVAHSVSMMVVQAGAGQRLIASDPTGAGQSLDHIGEAARQAELELGRLLALLAEDSARDASAGLLLIDELVRRAEATGLAVTCRLTGGHDDLPDEVAQAAYRIAQEGLTNALKHAPGAPVEIAVEVAEPAVKITVHNSPPPQPRSELEGAGGHHGLRGMHERVHGLGGTLEAGPTSDGGWRLDALIPR